ncbi:restriction endonuclease subunit S [Fibrobacter sp.]|uniref:restriction endonuclease subunit S n=1 Tax=Fibrobacter sp. TaxID=35828 RepID=UPI00386D985E
MSKWIEKELGKLCYIEKGDQLNKLALETVGTYPCINGGVEPSGYTEKYNRMENTISISEGGNSCGYVNLMKRKFWAGGHCYTLRENELLINKNFLYCVLKYNQERIMQLRVGSGLPNIQRNALADYVISYPEDIEEQKRIAAVLTKADELIDATQELIDKQKKIKTGLMQTLLTCGIDKNGVIRSPKTHKFKDSELGPIPEEWECVELGSYSKSIADGDHMPPPKVEYGIPFVTIGNVKNESIDFSNTMYVGYDYFSSIDIKRKPQKGDVLYTVVASFGIPILMKNDQDFVFQRHIAIIRPKEDFKSEFLFYYLKSEAALKQADDSAVGVAQRTISLTSLRAYKVVKPSLAEQDCIVSILQQQDQIIKDLEFEKQKYIDIKKGLMADLLSGKVKVSA